jgi:hypothetical protein
METQIAVSIRLEERCKRQAAASIWALTAKLSKPQRLTMRMK